MPGAPLHPFSHQLTRTHPLDLSLKLIYSLEALLTPVVTSGYGFGGCSQCLFSRQDREGRAVSAQFTLASLCLGQNLVLGHYL